MWSAGQQGPSRNPVPGTRARAQGLPHLLLHWMWSPGDRDLPHLLSVVTVPYSSTRPQDCVCTVHFFFPSSLNMGLPPEDDC